MTKLSIKAEQRIEFGRKVKSLRKKGILPANIYGKKVKSTAITVDMKQFMDLFKKAGETNIVNIVVGKQTKPTLIHNIQTDPVTDLPLHVDFLQVDLKEKVTAQIPVILTGESPAEKQGLGTVVQYADEIEVEALHMDLPEKFEVDSSKLEKVDDQVVISEISVDKSKIEVIDDKEKIVAKVEPLREEEPQAVVEEEKPEGEEGEEPKDEQKEGAKEEEKEKEEKAEESPKEKQDK